MKTGLIVASWMALAGLLTGCTTAPQCEALATCGGDFLVGAADWANDGVTRVEWVAAPRDACVDEVASPTQPPSLALIPARPAGVRAIEPGTLNWCADLRFNSNGSVAAFDDGWYETIVKYHGWFPAVPLFTARLEIASNNRYELDTTQLIAQHYELPKTCMYAQGVAVSCSDFAIGLSDYIGTRLKGLEKSGIITKIYGVGPDGRANCTPAADGCSCDYNLQLTSVTTGPWATSTGEITFFDSSAQPPSRTDYCAGGDSLQLTGDRDTDLFNRVSLKTLEFGPASCADGVQSKSLGETGIDCGGTCPQACP